MANPAPKLLTYNNETKPLQEWAEQVGINADTLRGRINDDGWTVEKALTTPARDLSTNIEINGITLEQQEWLKYLKITRQALHKTAKARNLTPTEELIRRFAKKPELFPKHLLPPQR